MRILAVVFALALSACSSVIIKPGTLDKKESVLVEQGGFSMKHAVKHSLEERGYDVRLGRLIRKGGDDDGYGNKIDFNSRYIVKVSERDRSFSPVLCFAGGFYWWNFSMSVWDNITEKEILSWTARGCANTMLRKLDRYLDELENK
ncbi:MAG: hypothetical protein LBH81_01685 [Rickettsiales bacterium]|jgi:hypothetical protein|nr:hypothetical protein [Rickettsiales bacterium]